MEAYGGVIAGSSTNVVEPTSGEIAQGNNQLTPFNSAVNNGYMRQMSQQISDLSTEVINVIDAAGLTPSSSLDQLLTAINILKIPSAATTSAKGIGFLPSLITIANNSSDANNDIDFSVGNFTVSDGSAQGLASSIETKRLDATWATGNNAGGLAAGLTKANSTWYHCFKLLNPTTGATGSGYDTSLAATNLLADSAVIAAGFTKYRRVGSIKTDSSGNIIPFYQIEKKIYWSAWIQDIGAALSYTSSVVTTLTVPPLLGIIALTQVNLVANNDINTTVKGLIQSNLGSSVLSSNLYNLIMNDTGLETKSTNCPMSFPVDSLGRVKSIFSAVQGCSFDLWVLGWEDTTL